jgi:NAD(P)-dependent dehydrogenase (short-subunit alcohol dehydrogenase family)
MSGRLEDRVAVVTGGGNGIGRACCERFAEEGADVVVGDLLDDQARETAELVSKLGRRAVAVHLDASQPDDNERLMDTAIGELGPIDIVVTAAGISHADYRSGDLDVDTQMVARAMEGMANPSKPFLDLELAAWRKVLDVNLTGTFLALQAAARRMVASGRPGSLITIASVAAKVPEAGPTAYSVSKAGVWMLTKHVARSLGPSGIRVNAIGPGFIETNMTRVLTELPMVRDQLVATLPLRRAGAPREVADVALFLASEESAYMTGEILHPDGGLYTD